MVVKVGHSDRCKVWKGMSSWLLKGEVLVGEGRGEISPCSPRLRSSASSRPGRSRGPSASVSPWEETQKSGTLQQETLGKARELFLLCDKEEKGFITKRDMQRLQGEVPLSQEQLECVFDSLDREQNGFLTPMEFSLGLGELVWVDEKDETEEGGGGGVVDPEEQRFTQILVELGADKRLKDQWEIHALWCCLQRDRPELLSVLGELLSHAVSQLRDAFRERDNLEQALRRREIDHDQIVHSIYEEMDIQIREERERLLSQEAQKESDRCQQLLKELKRREEELESTMAKQRELEITIQKLNSEQADTRGQNQKLQNVNLQLQEQLETTRAALDGATGELNQFHTRLAYEQSGFSSNVLKVSKNMQREKESLMRQLGLLREMNKRLRDDKDVHQSVTRVNYNSSICTLPPFPQSIRCEPDHSSWAHPLYPY